METINLIENFIYSKFNNNYESLKFMSVLSEEQKLNVSDKLIASLYKSVLEKYNAIDFGNIPKSKGDITKLKEYDTIKETISLLNEIKKKSNITKFEELETIELSLSILENNKTDFCNAFLQNKQIVIVLYNTIVLSIVSSLNLLISTMVEYISTPDGDYEAILVQRKQNKSSTNIMISNLKEFNSFAQKGELKKFLNHILGKKAFIGAGLVLAGGVMASTIIIISIIRELIYYAFDIRMGVSEYLYTQANFLEMNAMSLKTNKNLKTKQDKKKVIKQQETYIKKLRKFSDKISVKFEVSDANTRREINNKEINKISVDDMKNSMVNDEVGFTLM